MSCSNLMLNKLFTQYNFEDLMQHNENKTYSLLVDRYSTNQVSKSNGELISEIYRYMSKKYRNEYIYQNTLLNKLLIGRHSINTTTALTQIPIGKSKADFIMINGKAVVYEIKTELDSFERLGTQLADYYKAFNHVCVVTCEDSFERLSSMLENTTVGICILTNKNTLKFRKEPQKNNVNLQYDAIFKVLRKKEFETILQEYFHILPQATPVFYYDECYKWFKRIPLSEVYEMTLKQLKKRNHISKDLFSDVPYELKSLMYFYNASKEDYLRLGQFLQEKYGGKRDVFSLC